MTKENQRIDVAYEEGGSVGDLGYSNLHKGGIVSKGGAFGDVYSSIEWLQHGINKYVYNDLGNYTELVMSQIEETDASFLEWLQEALFSLSSFCYRKGNTLPEYNLMFPVEAYDFLVRRIDYFKGLEKEKQTEFIRTSGTLNKLRLQTRDVERHFITWFNDPVVIQEYRTVDYVLGNIRSQIKFLNRLSTYFYWLTRYVAIKEGKKHDQWCSSVPPFPLTNS